MDTQVLTKPQEPWIGSRGRIGVIIPSTNTGVEYDCLRLVPRVSQGHYRSLTFVVDAEQFSVRETTIVDPVGGDPVACTDILCRVEGEPTRKDRQSTEEHSLLVVEELI